MTHDDQTLQAGRSRDPDIPDRIGRYRILGVIGDGGFGRVFEAEQTEPVRRRVALKVIKAGMDSKQVLARFEAERQALAVMDHPGIAKFLDAGMTEAGRPFFAMEHVKGIAVTEFCEQERMKLDDRVKLMIQVCHAVLHAHMKGVIHRDLKPSNILVQLIDQKPVVKVIDFGVAKALAQPLTGSTIYTERGQMIGTPEYMSPEQARGTGVDVDTRADVYSLGAILYELLTGLTPFDSTAMRSKGYAELQRFIEHEEAPRPSLRLTCGARTPSGQGEPPTFSIDPVAMSRRLKGELDWIVMKCLEKERARRYDTPSALAADLERYLHDEPVVAGPPSVTYRARKFIKRNKALVTGGVLVATVMVLGITGTTWGLIWALNEKERADTQTIAANENATRATEATERAERELARATEVKQLISDMLAGVDPNEARGADTTILVGILDDTAARLQRGEVSDERVAAELHHVIGRVYQALGRLDSSERHIAAAMEIRRRVLGDEHPDTLSSMNLMAISLWSLNRFAEGEAMYREAAEISERALGPDDQYTLMLLGNLAIILGQQRRYAEALPLQEEILTRRRRTLGNEHPHTLGAMSSLALLYHEEYRFTDAEPLYVEALRLTKKVHGERHPEVLDLTLHLGMLYTDQGRYVEADSMLVKNLEDYLQVIGGVHRNTQQVKVALGVLRMKQRRFVDAERLMADAAESHRQEAGLRHPWTLDAFTKLGHVYLLMERYEDARAAFETAVPTMRDFLGRRDPRTQSALSGISAAYIHLGRADEAAPYQTELLEFQQQAVDDENVAAHTLNEAASTLLMAELGNLRDPARALELATRACEKEQADNGRIFWKYLDTKARAQHLAGDTAAAIETQRRAVALAPGIDELKTSLATYEATLAEGDGQ